MNTTPPRQRRRTVKKQQFQCNKQKATYARAARFFCILLLFCMPEFNVKLPETSQLHARFMGEYRTCFRSHFFLRHLRYYLFSVACCDSANRCCQYGRVLSTLFLYLNHDREMFFCQLLNSSAVSVTIQRPFHILFI